MSASVDRAMAVHPWRTREHTEELDTLMRKNGIPFCHECADWHYPDDVHSAQLIDGEWK